MRKSVSIDMSDLLDLICCTDFSDSSNLIFLNYFADWMKHYLSDEEIQLCSLHTKDRFIFLEEFRRKYCNGRKAAPDGELEEK
jgi:hypothetical protein